jgi:hypothetical protein
MTAAGDLCKEYISTFTACEVLEQCHVAIYFLFHKLPATVMENPSVDRLWDGHCPVRIAVAIEGVNLIFRTVEGNDGYWPRGIVRCWEAQATDWRN